MCYSSGIMNFKAGGKHMYTEPIRDFTDGLCKDTIVVYGMFEVMELPRGYNSENK